MERRGFYQASMNYVLILQEVQERKKFEFVEVVSWWCCFILLNYYFTVWLEGRAISGYFSFWFECAENLFLVFLNMLKNTNCFPWNPNIFHISYCPLAHLSLLFTVIILFCFYIILLFYTSFPVLMWVESCWGEGGCWYQLLLHLVLIF